MAKESDLKIGLYILAVALLGAPATQASSAENAASSADHPQGSNLPAEPSGMSKERSSAVKAREVKTNFKLGGPGSIHVRRLPAPAAAKPAERNAIGLPVTQHEGIQESSGESHGFPAQIPAREAPGIAGSGVGNLAKTDGGFARPTIARPGASPIASAPVAQRGTISGTGLIRPGFGPSGVGGPTKMVAGINGTNTRPKH
jgi:hypothetical protein